MNLIDLIRRESSLSIPKLLMLAGVAGVANAGVLAIINTAVSDASNNEHSVQNAAMFLAVIAIYFVAQRRVMMSAIEEIEMVLSRVRVRIADKIRHVDLRPLEEQGRTAIYSSVQKETTTISQSASILVMGVQFAILVFFTAIYIAVLSLPAFFLTILSTSLVGGLFLMRSKKLNEGLHQTLIHENNLFDALTHFLDGFKEIRMNQARSDDVFARFQQVSNTATTSRIETQSEISSQFILSQIAFYFMVAVIVFIVPQMSSGSSETITQVSTAILFLIGPIGGVVNAVPNLATANAACENIHALEEALAGSAEPAPPAFTPLKSFKEISFENVVFSYSENGNRFTVGPINLSFSSGELIFITGGNGAGKSTLMKLLTSLYSPTQGVVTLDGKPLDGANRESYRSLFSVIFAEYHLFDRLYGLKDVSSERIAETIEYLQLSEKVKVVDHEFETLHLSGGQRKRLALLVSLLEDRPICVYDEVAADQDPEFRKRYYEKILPELKAQGKTVIVVTHDDRYFELADRLIKMESGRVVNDV